MGIVELRVEQTNNATDGLADSLSCRREFWNLMLALGNAFGWKSLGTSYLSTTFKSVEGQATRRHDYQPGTWSDAKRVAAEDAFAWAEALRMARSSPHLNNMLATNDENAASDVRVDTYTDDVDVRDSIDDFISLLRKGALLFAICDREQEKS